MQRVDQEKLNYLHHFFDQMRGPVNDPSEVYLSSDDETRKQMNIYNESIHALENILTHRAIGRGPIPYIYVEFMDTEKLKFSKDVYPYFTLEREVGDLFVHYSQVGKSWLEAYEDEDDIMEKDNIRPHEFYDGSFDICFRARKREDTLKLEKELRSYITQMGVDPNQESHALGRLVVAKFKGIQNIDLKTTEEEIKLITGYSFIKKIELI